jgi:hypothetical protein
MGEDKNKDTGSDSNHRFLCFSTAMKQKKASDVIAGTTAFCVPS